eukprot:2579171-Prymnesium_polylepis.1
MSTQCWTTPPRCSPPWLGLDGGRWAGPADLGERGGEPVGLPVRRRRRRSSTANYCRVQLTEAALRTRWREAGRRWES